MSPSRRIPTKILDRQSIGLEGRVVSDDHQSLKVWLRLLSCSTQVERTIRKRLRLHAGITLARFDFLAQLHRHPDGLAMSVMSRYLMVTGGNVTGLADELEKEGLVERCADPNDGRSSRVSLTRKGRRLFDKLATTHEAWIVSMFDGMSAADMRLLYEMLGRLRVQLTATEARTAPAVQETPPITTRRRRRSGALT